MTESITAGELAERVRAIESDSVLGFDVDGVLAPIVEHADDARLPEGVWADLDRIARRATLAIVSGRSLDSLATLFDFPADAHVLGSHGLEERGSGTIELTDDEHYTLDQLTTLGTKAVDAIGDGAWLEHKVASVVVHTRSADPTAAAEAVVVLQRLANLVDGAIVKPGSEVVELMARHGHKGDALVSLARRLGTRARFFMGDDITDEDAFASLDPAGISVRVGPGPTRAMFRLDSPVEVAAFLADLASG